MRELNKSERLFEALVENNDGIISLMDENFNVIYRSSSAVRIMGWPHEEYQKTPYTKYVHPDDEAYVKAILVKSISNPEKIIPLTTRVMHKNGNYILLEGVVTNMIHDKDINGIIINLRDTTKRNEAEQKINRLKRLYHFISQINQMIVRTSDEQTLFKEACQIAVNIGGFQAAWMGIINRESNLMEPIEHEGLEDGFLSILKNKIDNAHPRKSDAIATAILKGNTVVSNDLETGDLIQLWKAKGIKHDQISYIALPIKKSGKVIGSFNLYTGVKNFFDKEEIEFLEEAASDISFALDMFEKEASRKKAEQSVVESGRRYKTLAEMSPVGIFHTDKTGYTTYVNPRWCQISGMTYPEAIGNGWLNAVHDDDKRKLSDDWIEAAKNKRISLSEYRFVHADGTTSWVMGQAVPEINFENEVVGYIGTITDITQRKIAEEKIKDTSEQLRQLALHLQSVREEERKRIGREIHDELGQQLTAIKMGVAWIDKKIPPETDQVKNKIKNIIELLDGSNKSIKRILSELRSGILDDHDLLGAIEWLGKKFTENTGIPVKFSFPEKGINAPEPIGNCIFRLCQEAFTNITRHSEASKVFVSLGVIDHTVTATVEDDGVGFDIDSVQYNKSFGILGMKERVLSLGGKFELISSQGQGTKIALQLPYTPSKKK